MYWLEMVVWHCCTLIRTSLQICLASSQHFCSGTVQHFFLGSSQHLSFGSSQHLVCGACNVKQLTGLVHQNLYSYLTWYEWYNHELTRLPLGSLKIDDLFSVSGHSLTSEKQDLPASNSDLNPILKFSPRRYFLPCFLVGQKAIGREKNVLINDPDSQYWHTGPRPDIKKGTANETEMSPWGTYDLGTYSQGTPCVPFPFQLI